MSVSVPYKINSVDDSEYQQDGRLVLHGRSEVLDSKFKTELTRKRWLDSRQVDEGIFYVLDTDCHHVWKIDTILIPNSFVAPQSSQAESPDQEQPTELQYQGVFPYQRWHIPCHVWICAVGSFTVSI